MTTRLGNVEDEALSKIATEARVRLEPALQGICCIGVSSRITVRNYPGGHMSFLDDGTRPVQRADVAAFIQAALAAQPARRAPLRAQPPSPPDRVGVPAAATGPVLPEPALQVPMRDPWVPPSH